MIHYQTYKEKKQQIRNAVMGDTNIHIDLITCVGNSDNSPEKYYIKHGNYSPAIEDYLESSDSYFITGQDDGFPNGFQSISDIQRFVNEEIERIEEKKTEALINPNFKNSDGISFERWDMVLKAWGMFREKLKNAIKEDKICDYNSAINLYRGLVN